MFYQTEFENVFGFYGYMLKDGVTFMRNKIFLIRQKGQGPGGGGGEGSENREDWGDNTAPDRQPRA